MDALPLRYTRCMKRALNIVGNVIGILILTAFIGLLVLVLGVQPALGKAHHDAIHLCIALACGGLLMMAIYNSMLSLFIRREKAAQYFSVFCIGQAVRFFFMPGSVGAALFPQLNPYLVLFGLRYLPYMAALVGITLFVCEVFGEGRALKIKYAIIATVVVVNIVVPAVGGDQTTLRTAVGLPAGLFVNIALIYVIVTSKRLRQERLSILYLIGFILYFFSFFITATTYGSGPIFAVVFNFVFAVIHLILLSSRSAKVLDDIESANAALQRRLELLPESYPLGDLSLNLTTMTAYLDGTDLRLTQKEFSLLLCFLRHREDYLTADELYETIWGSKMGSDTSALKTMVARLRKKLGDSRYTIAAVRNKGYRFQSKP